MSEEVHGRSPLRHVCLLHGDRLRYIRGFKSIWNREVNGEAIFTPDEQDMIKLIAADAEERAERKYREERTEAESRSGTATEHRQYTGK